MCKNVIFWVTEEKLVEFIDAPVFFFYIKLCGGKKGIGNAQLLQHINDVMQAEAKEFHITKHLPRQNPKPPLLGFKMYSLLTKALGCNSALLPLL